MLLQLLTAMTEESCDKSLTLNLSRTWPLQNHKVMANSELRFPLLQLLIHTLLPRQKKEDHFCQHWD